ncbi:efflux RND transporter periplasmic adaptor subunit [Pseudolysinimonas sp.]|jgi:RND family efflux transporter MFP subunit|uniref:efflux RND transporter periplasmic adaptor subunit n=1 Tax=Pseudolysinimonas sp. TaxID=2680009 RepID=UPI003783094F
MSVRETAIVVARRTGSGITSAARRGRAVLIGVPRKLRIPLAFGTAGVLVVAGAGLAWASTGSSNSAYVTAVAEVGSVDEQLALTGSLASATRRDVAFTVAGTVATVEVATGDEVVAGATLATLDLDELQDAVDTAEESVARAEQQLDDDLTGQTTTSSTSSGGGASSSSTAATDPSESGALDEQIAAVVAAQDALLALMDAADTSLAEAHTAGTDATAVCDPFLAATLPDDPAAFDATALAAIQDLLSTCTSAIDGVLDAADVAAAAQDAVAASMDALDAAIDDLQQAAAELETSLSSGTDSTGSGGSGSSTAAGSGGSTSQSTASAADIVADRAAIAAAEAELAIAKSALGAAALVSPIDGTVAQVALAVGDEVEAGSTTAIITIIGDDGYIVETTVGLADLTKLAVGQSGEAVISSSGASYAASVVALGFVNVATDSTTPSYTLTISVDAGGEVLLNGAAVQIVIDVAAASDVIVVPVSAVHRSDTGDTVDVLVNGQVEARAVEIGAVGDVYVEITSGLEEGDVVVLADSTEEITAETDETTTGLTGIGGGTQTGPGGGGEPPTGGFPTAPQG